MTEEKYYRKAQKIVKAKTAFRVNAWIFAAVMPILVIINLWTTPGYLWFLWALMGWGLMLAIMYLVAYILPKYDRNESREVEEEVEKMRLRNRKEEREDDDYDYDYDDERLKLKELRKDYDERDFV